MELYINDWSRYRYRDINIDSDNNEYFNFINETNYTTEDYLKYTVRTNNNIFRITGYIYYTEEFNANQLWWAVAELNNIIDPFVPLKPGQVLSLPNVEKIKTLDRYNDLFGVV